jgi:hypothetical protein
MHALRSILITGGNRTGTSWTGKMLGLSGETFLVWEPFNNQNPIPGIFPSNPLDRHYHKLLPGEEEVMGRFMKSMVILGLVRSCRPEGRFGGPLLDPFRITAAFWRYMTGSVIPLFKDPIALMSAEWVQRKFDSSVVVMIRHPAAYVNSIRRLGWRTPLEDFLVQDSLMNDLPEDLRHRIMERAGERPEPGEGEFDLQDAALCWKVFHTVIARYSQDHPDWIFVRHEDLCGDYMNSFRDLYERVGLSWSERVADRIEAHCGSSNPVTQGDSIHVFRQDSESLAGAWKNSMTRDDIQRIREFSSPVWEYFYDADSWD